MHIFYIELHKITFPQLGLSRLLIVVEVYSICVQIATNDKGGLEMVDNDLTVSNNEQTSIIDKDGIEEFDTMSKGSYPLILMATIDNNIVDESPDHLPCPNLPQLEASFMFAPIPNELDQGDEPQMQEGSTPIAPSIASTLPTNSTSFSTPLVTAPRQPCFAGATKGQTWQAQNKKKHLAPPIALHAEPNMTQIYAKTLHQKANYKTTFF